MSFAEDALFDIIIVGSCAGGVLAARLSDNPNLRILLLEAGPDHRTATMSPEMKAVNPMALWADPTWTWRHSSLPAGLCRMGRCVWVRGVGLEHHVALPTAAGE